MLEKFFHDKKYSTVLYIVRDLSGEYSTNNYTRLNGHTSPHLSGTVWYCTVVLYSRAIQYIALYLHSPALYCSPSTVHMCMVNHYCTE